MRNLKEEAILIDLVSVISFALTTSKELGNSAKTKPNNNILFFIFLSPTT